MVEYSQDLSRLYGADFTRAMRFVLEWEKELEYLEVPPPAPPPESRLREP